jgi:membrane protein implicated in regulation of membrane protease activity
MAAPGFTKALTITAAAFLAFDGAALIVGGWLLHRTTLLALGIGLLLGSLLVAWSWRWHRRQVAEMNRARADLAADARKLQDLIRRN